MDHNLIVLAVLLHLLFFSFYANLFAQVLEFRVFSFFLEIHTLPGKVWTVFFLLIIIPTGKINTFPRMHWNLVWLYIDVVLEAELYN